MGYMMFFNKTLDIETGIGPSIIDITDKVFDVVNKQKIKQGYLLLFIQHTTAALKINEAEPNLLKDMQDFFNKAVSNDLSYNHNVVDERTNAHSHLKSLFLETSLFIPIVDGKLALGAWQNILFFEFDGPRKRTVMLQVFGE